MNLRRRLGLEWLVVTLMVTIIIGVVQWRNSAAALDNLLYDSVSGLARPAGDPDILLVTIDDASLSQIGRWPWDRSTHARMLDQLQAAEPRSIIFDVLLPEDGTASGDAELAHAMRGPSPVIAPVHFTAPGTDGKAFDLEMPAQAFTSAIDSFGHANVSFDSDGIVRRAALCFQPEAGAKKWPHLVELTWRGRQGKPSKPYQAMDYCGEEYLFPYAPRGSFSEIPYADVLNGSVPPSLIKGRDVIVAATATGMGDNFPVPLRDGAMLSGGEIMANMLSALRSDTFIRPLGVVPSILLSLLPNYLLLVGFLRWRPRNGLIMSFASIVFVLGASALLLRAHIWFPPGAALVGISIVYPLWGWRRLQATSNFMMHELGELQSERGFSGMPVAPGVGEDLIGRQSAQLAQAIGHMRDLRRFVADTLADLPDPMFVTDLEGKITLTNRALDERLGRPILGLNMTEALGDTVEPGYRRAVIDYLSRTETPRPDGITPEFVRFVAQADRTIVLRRSELRADSGQPVGHIHYLTDITDLARAEAEREEVLQLLSHDMRAPQSTIIALLAGPIDDAAKKRIERNARRTMQLAQDFVDIARMGETEFSGEDILLADLVRDAADGLWPLADERRITVEIEDRSNDAFVLAEPDSLTRAMSNLIDNAIKFSPDNARIGISVDRNGNDLQVAIRDHGSGIDPAILPRLFSRFATGGQQNARAKGTGLGLTYVSAVIERHGGRLWVANAPDGGAIFTFALPEAAEPG